MEETPATPAAAPTTEADLTPATALAVLIEHRDELPVIAKYGVGVVERHLNDEVADVNKASFDEVYQKYAAPGQVYSAMDALGTVMWDIIYDEEEEGRLDKIDQAFDSCKSVVRGILTNAGVKSADTLAIDPAPTPATEAEPEAAAASQTTETPEGAKTRKVTIGDQEVEVEMSEEGALLFGLLQRVMDRNVELTGEVEALKAAGPSGTEATPESASEPETPAPLDMAAALALMEKSMDEKIAKARSPLFHGSAFSDEDTTEAGVAKRETPNGSPVDDGRSPRQKGATVRPGLLGLQRK
jgi:hypothetical protein